MTLHKLIEEHVGEYDAMISVAQELAKLNYFSTSELDGRYTAADYATFEDFTRDGIEFNMQERGYSGCEDQHIGVHTVFWNELDPYVVDGGYRSLTVDERDALVNKNLARMQAWRKEWEQRKTVKMTASEKAAKEARRRQFEDLKKEFGE